MNNIKQQLRGSFAKDGTDHLCVSVYAETELGKITSPDWRKNFFVPHVGDFVTARAFANWVVSGGKEELRHSTAYYKTSVPVADFRLLILFAKYYQLGSMRFNLIAGQKLLPLPWVMYKKHFSGVREFDRWEVYSSLVKGMVEFIIDNGSKVHYNWQDVNPDVIACLDYYMEKITGKEFMPFDELNRIAKEKSLKRSASDKAKNNQSDEDEGFGGFYSSRAQVALEPSEAPVQQQETAAEGSTSTSD